MTFPSAYLIVSSIRAKLGVFFCQELDQKPGVRNPSVWGLSGTMGLHGCRWGDGVGKGCLEETGTPSASATSIQSRGINQQTKTSWPSWFPFRLRDWDQETEMCIAFYKSTVDIKMEFHRCPNVEQTVWILMIHWIVGRQGVGAKSETINWWFDSIKGWSRNTPEVE